MNRPTPQVNEVSSMSIKAHKRVHAKPQVTIHQDFVVQTPGHLIDIAIAHKLTSVEWSLWMYLMRVNPFADFTSDNEPIYRDVPSPSELAIILGRDRKTIERAGRRLNELGLYKLRTKSWEGFNETAAESKKLLQQRKDAKSQTELPSPNRDKIVPNRTKKSQRGTKQSQTELPSPKQELKLLSEETSSLSQTPQTSSNSPEFEEVSATIAAATQPQLEVVSAAAVVIERAAALGCYPTAEQREMLMQLSDRQLDAVITDFEKAVRRGSKRKKTELLSHSIRMGRYASTTPLPGDSV